MDEISNSKSKKTMLFVIVIMGAFLVLVGVSYAYFVAFVTSDEQEIQSGVLELTYNTGKDILLEKATPTEEENASDREEMMPQEDMLPEAIEEMEALPETDEAVQ